MLARNTTAKVICNAKQNRIKQNIEKQNKTTKRKPELKQTTAIETKLKTWLAKQKAKAMAMLMAKAKLFYSVCLVFLLSLFYLLYGIYFSCLCVCVCVQRIKQRTHL